MADIPIDRVVGSISGKALYPVSISVAALDRARELSAALSAPDWIELTAAGISTARVATTDPQWFIELDAQIRAAAAGSRR
jgi:hypothetical protein